MTRVAQTIYYGRAGRGPPHWFISHWWGEPVFDFIKAVMAHAKARGLEETAPYWVCAYAD